ncbi:hypothetical protein [Corynebacterium coyleae]|uniref:hypothetical protein n=2 Tax=Corynebacterium coyleae TaxID=53374 RepID=UPI0011AE6A0B|nr:hypothetical protein [Corynebacterium coyleae]
MFQQKQAVKSPIPNQKQTNQHHKQMLDWQNKIQKLPEAKKLPTNPHPDGAKTRVGNMHHALTNEAHHTDDQAINGSPNHHRHTPHKACTPWHTTPSTQQQKMHWHTIEFSNNTSTPKHTHTTMDTFQVT